MKKILRSRIFAFILGAIIFSGITGVTALTLLANDILYTPSDANWKKQDGSDIKNVKDAIDELYGKASNKGDKKTITLTCGSYDKTGNAIQCNLSGKENTAKKITIKNIEYLRNSSFQVGYKIIGSASEVTFNSINIGDTFDINNQSYSISFYGTAGNTYSVIKMELEIE